jgi:hypothetical protein
MRWPDITILIQQVDCDLSVLAATAPTSGSALVVCFPAPGTRFPGRWSGAMVAPAGIGRRKRHGRQVE